LTPEHRNKAAALVGDVDLESIKNEAAFISPVPGGVGPVTGGEVMANVLKVAKQLKHKN